MRRLAQMRSCWCSGAGLNPMGRGDTAPRAGCPVVNLERTLDDLVRQAGLSVVRS